MKHGHLTPAHLDGAGEGGVDGRPGGALEPWTLDPKPWILDPGARALMAAEKEA